MTWMAGFSARAFRITASVASRSGVVTATVRAVGTPALSNSARDAASPYNASTPRLRKSRTIDRVRVGFLGVKHAYQHTGVAAALYVEHFDTASRVRQKWGEMGWILESNRSMNRAMEARGGRVVRRYRVFERAL